MDIDPLDYAQRTDNALAAAAGATSIAEFQAHLAEAVRFAALDSMAQRRLPHFNVVPIRPGTGGYF